MQENQNRDPTASILQATTVTMFFFFFVGGLLWLLAADRNLFDKLMWEDSAGEWATFFAFAIAGMTGVCVLVGMVAGKVSREKKRRPSINSVGLSRLITLALPTAFCILAAGEEISWGQRVLGIMPPEVFQTMNSQQELNFHNILQQRISPRVIIAMICFGYGVAAPLWSALHHSTTRTYAPADWLEKFAPAIWLSPWFALTGIVYWVSNIMMAFEAAELMLGLLFLVDILNKSFNLRQSFQIPRWWIAAFLPLVMLVTSLALGFAANPLLERFVFNSDSELIAKAQQELEKLGSELESYGAINPGLANSDELSDFRIYMGVREGLVTINDPNEFIFETSSSINVDLASLRSKYYLDPWNNAYWLRMQGFQPIFLYSFGPNRRLDTIPKDRVSVPRPGETEGDDIGFWIDPFRNHRQATPE
ncbi:MAG: hypothetical protein P8L85_12155 [Rubripirellula sp.]|nr:hypothetical protein [Rubripirellula sp.]